MIADNNDYATLIRPSKDIVTVTPAEKQRSIETKAQCLNIFCRNEIVIRSIFYAYKAEIQVIAVPFIMRHCHTSAKNG